MFSLFPPSSGFWKRNADCQELISRINFDKHFQFFISTDIKSHHNATRSVVMSFFPPYLPASSLASLLAEVLTSQGLHLHSMAGRIKPPSTLICLSLRNLKPLFQHKWLWWPTYPLLSHTCKKCPLVPCWGGAMTLTQPHCRLLSYALISAPTLELFKAGLDEALGAMV